eukprot:gene7453-182_t
MSKAQNAIALTSYDPTLAVNAAASPPALVTFQAIERILVDLLGSPEGVQQIINSQAEAYQAHSAGTTPGSDPLCSSIPIQTAGQPPQPQLLSGPGAQVCIKTGYIKGDSVLVSKIAAGGGSSGNTGAVSVYDQTTLRLRAVLCDEGLLTEVRTAAACAFASRAALGGRAAKVTRIGMVGGGVQAVWQLRMLAAAVFSCSTSCRTVVLKTRSRDSADAFIRRMQDSPFKQDREWQFEHYDCQGDRFRACQLIHTCTPAREDVLAHGDVTVPGPDAGEGTFLHITAVGADSVGKHELSSDLVAASQLCLCDSALQSMERGEFQSSRKFDPCPTLVEIGKEHLLLADNTLAKPVTFSIFDSSGIALQDVMMAKLVASRL